MIIAKNLQYSVRFPIILIFLETLFQKVPDNYIVIKSHFFISFAYRLNFDFFKPTAELLSASRNPS